MYVPKSRARGGPSAGAPSAAGDGPTSLKPRSSAGQLIPVAASESVSRGTQVKLPPPTRPPIPAARPGPAGGRMLAGGGWDGLDDCVAASVAAGELGPAAADQTATGGFDRRLRSPCAVVPGRAGTGCFFVCDLHSVRRVDARTGHIQTMAGCGEPGACSYMQPPRSCLWLGSYRLRSLWPAQLNPARGASGFCDGAPAAARFSWDLSYTIPIGCVLLHGPPLPPSLGACRPRPPRGHFFTLTWLPCVSHPAGVPGPGGTQLPDRLFVCDSGNHRIREVVLDVHGRPLTVATVGAAVGETVLSLTPPVYPY